MIPNNKGGGLEVFLDMKNKFQPYIDTEYEISFDFNAKGNINIKKREVSFLDKGNLTVGFDFKSLKQESLIIGNSEKSFFKIGAYDLYSKIEADNTHHLQFNVVVTFQKLELSIAPTNED